jgi:hypothetical protein
MLSKSFEGHIRRGVRNKNNWNGYEGEFQSHISANPNNTTQLIFGIDLEIVSLLLLMVLIVEASRRGLLYSYHRLPV